MDDQLLRRVATRAIIAECWSETPEGMQQCVHAKPDGPDILVTELFTSRLDWPVSLRLLLSRGVRTESKTTISVAATVLAQFFGRRLKGIVLGRSR